LAGTLGLLFVWGPLILASILCFLLLQHSRGSAIHPGVIWILVVLLLANSLLMSIAMIWMLSVALLAIAAGIAHHLASWGTLHETR
jgi:hypothetical protein